MVDIFVLLVLAGLLLAVVPQLIGYGIVGLCLRQGLRWGAVIIGTVVPPVLFWLIVQYVYSGETASVLQSGLSADGGIQVSHVRLGTQIHAGVAAVIHAYRVVSKG